MRRSDREIKDIEKIHDVMQSCTTCRLGFYDDGEVYIVPLNFGIVRFGDETTLYFHSAKEGRKITLIQKNPTVGFEMDTNFLLKSGDVACEYTAQFESIIGTGDISFVSDFAEKEKALCSIMHHHTGKNDWTFPKKEVDAVCIFKVVIKTMSCKIHE